MNVAIERKCMRKQRFRAGMWRADETSRGRRRRSALLLFLLVAVETPMSCHVMIRLLDGRDFIHSTTLIFRRPLDD